MRFLVRPAVLALALAPQVAVVAQQSASYEVRQHNFGAAGHPSSGMSLSSQGFRLSLGTVGQGTAQGTLSSPSYSTSVGFVAEFPPPGEVMDLSFQGPSTLVWTPERSVGTYNLYRGLLSDLRTTGYGGCQEAHLTSEIAVDTSLPSFGDGYLYLVTAVNLLGEEGTSGERTDGTARATPVPCP